jgi:hypothetical protein
MIPVQITCEAREVPPAERVDPERDRFWPVLMVNGAHVWRGRPQPTEHEAEAVALGYVRYTLGGGPPPPGEPGDTPPDGEPRSSADAVTDALEAIRRDLTDAVDRATKFIESGEWKRLFGQ